MSAVGYSIHWCLLSVTAFIDVYCRLLHSLMSTVGYCIHWFLLSVTPFIDVCCRLLHSFCRCQTSLALFTRKMTVPPKSNTFGNKEELPSYWFVKCECDLPLEVRYKIWKCRLCHRSIFCSFILSSCIQHLALIHTPPFPPASATPIRLSWWRCSCVGASIRSLNPPDSLNAFTRVP